MSERDIRALMAEIERAHESGDAALLDRLQAEFRASGHTYRMGGTAGLREATPQRGGRRAADRQPLSSNHRRAAAMTMTRDELRAWRNSKIDRVMLTSDAVRELAYLDYGSGVEAGGGIYGEILNGAFLVRQLEDFSREATRDQVRVRYEDMAARHRPDVGLSWIGHWHSHEQWDEAVSPSSADRMVWRSMTHKFGSAFLAMIGAPTSPGSEMTGPMWSRGGDWYAWGCEEIDGEVKIIELPVRRVS